MSNLSTSEAFREAVGEEIVMKTHKFAKGLVDEGHPVEMMAAVMIVESIRAMTAMDIQRHGHVPKDSKESFFFAMGEAFDMVMEEAREGGYEVK